MSRADDITLSAMTQRGPAFTRPDGVKVSEFGFPHGFYIRQIEKQVSPRLSYVLMRELPASAEFPAGHHEVIETDVREERELLRLMRYTLNAEDEILRRHGAPVPGEARVPHTVDHFSVRRVLDIEG